MTELLLRHGADINARDMFRNTPAHVAALEGDVDTMRVLIAAGIDFHALGFFRKTILHNAVPNRKGVLEYLLRQEGVRKIIHIKDAIGYTPLNYAVLPREREALKRVLELGENAKARENCGHCEAGVAAYVWRRAICFLTFFVLFSLVLLGRDGGKTVISLCTLVVSFVRS